MIILYFKGRKETLSPVRVGPKMIPNVYRCSPLLEDSSASRPYISNKSMAKKTFLLFNLNLCRHHGNLFLFVDLS